MSPTPQKAVAPEAKRYETTQTEWDRIAASKEFRNCSLIVMAASAAGALLTRRSRVVVDSCPNALLKGKRQNRKMVDACSAG